MRGLFPWALFSAATATVGLLLSLVLVPVAGSSAPEGFTVDTTIDSVDAHPGDGLCAATDGNCSLRAAIQETNALPGANAITLPAGLYRLTIAEYGFGAEPSANGDLDVTDDLTITGDGAWTTEIDQRAQQARILETTEGSVVAISGLTIRGGNTIGYPGAPDASGGGVLNAGTLTLDGVSVSGNSAGRAARGGGIWSSGPLTVLNSTISGNYAVFDGTGIDAGSVTIINSTISGNSGEFGGAAGIWAGSATLQNSTVAGNEGYNVFVSPGSLTTVNTIFAAPPGGANCSQFRSGSVVSDGHNIDSDASCGLSGPGDLSGADPQLLPLAANGGQTLTHALSPSSPAVDTPSPTPTPPAWARADLNCDHVVSSGDTLRILTFVAFGTAFTQQCPSAAAGTPARGDIDCDGEIDAVDALAILRYVAGIPLALPGGCPPL